MQAIATSIAALLASRDGIPENCVPVVAFERLDVTRQSIIDGDSRCGLLIQRVDRLARPVTEVGGPAPDFRRDAAAMKEMLRGFRGEFDASRGCLKWHTSSAVFMDFLNDPAGLAAAPVRSFLPEGGGQHFWKLVKDLIGLYEVRENREVFVALCCNAIAAECSPVARGFGVADEFSEDAFELFVEHDPLRWLARVAEFCQGKPFRAAFADIVRGLNAFSHSTREILEFVVGYSSPKFLRPKAQSARSEITAFMNSQYRGR
jgi:hypothetical protein